MTAPLDGIIVVALEQAVSAPLATRHLADLGATVLKVEHPDGGDLARHYDSNMAGQSSYFVWANRGKQSVALDLKVPADRTLFDTLVAGADVFVQNLSPAAAGRAGVLARHLHAAHPRLIACDISGYGLDGPRTDDKAYDLAIQAEAGAFALTGSPDEMAKVGISIADISAAMYALSSILAAVVRRDRTGEGAAIEISMLEALAEWAAPQIYTAVSTGVSPVRSSRRHPMIAPYGTFPLADGRTVLVAVQAQHEWRAFAADVLRQPDLADDPRFATNPDRARNVDELESIIREVFAALSPGQVVERLTSSRTAHSWVRGPQEVWDHEQLRARHRYVEVSTETGSATTFVPPFNLNDTPPATPAVPAVGAHSPAVIAKLRRRAANAGVSDDGL
jgi:crotonobetainyl-CoA:carnitine CoA-transferase CaiB-like acyl-CoA transferase